MTIRLIFAAFVLMFAVPAFADPVVIPQDSVLRGQFTEDKTVPGFKSPMHSTGHFLVAPAYGILWVVDTPFATATIITPHGLTQQIDGAQTMNLPANRIPFLTHLYAMIGGMLQGDWHALDQDFTIQRGGPHERWTVTLLPHQADNPAMPFARIDVRGGRFAERTILTRPDGSTDTIAFTDQKISAVPLSPREHSLFASVHP